MIRLLAISVLLTAALAPAANGIIPQALNYQGVLTGAGGAAVPDGTHSLTFRLYDVPSGGAPLWEETQGSVTVTKGIFNVALGSVTSLDLPFDEQYFLGIAVEGEAELTPRLYLDAAAYSLASRSVYGASNIIPADGDVGIGVTDPAEKLEVAGGILIGATSGTNAGTIRFSAGDFEGYDGGTWKSFTATGGSSLPTGGLGQTLRHNGIDWIATSNLYNSGSAIGLGTTTPGRDIHIYRDANSTAGITIENPNAGLNASERISFIGSSGDIAGLAVFGPGHSAYANHMRLFNNRGGGLLSLSAGGGGVTILDNGNVGVDVSNPNATLHVKGGNWDLDGTNGDLKIGDDAYRLKIGVATDGADAGIAGIRMQGGVERLILGAGSSEVLSVLSTGDVFIGSDTQDGELNMYMNGSAFPFMQLTSSAYGGELAVYEENGTACAALEPDYNGTGAYFYLRRSGAITGFRVDGNANGTGNPEVSIIGSSCSASFDMSQMGNPSVQLPANAVAAAEIDDEPGVASLTYSGVSIQLTGGTDVLMSRSITAPAAGYVLVIGTLCGWTSHSTGLQSYAQFGVSDNASVFPDNQNVILSIPSGANSGIYYFPVTVHGLFPVSAGSNSFYILGYEGNGDMRAVEMQLTLLYIPTAYGTVSPTLAGGRPAEAEDDATGSPLTAAGIAAERAESEAFDTARIERELAEMRARLEALERAGQENE
ncbi:MAG TPA: hypothetical protein VMX58_06145 [Patescibacteria group bacterium]|nr:hypothetical protein [Patescibacteria group bacterium]